MNSAIESAALAFLSEAEIATLTGRKYRAHQAAELARRGWVHELDANGRPLVARAYFDARMRGDSTAAIKSTARPRARPNFGALPA